MEQKNEKVKRFKAVIYFKEMVVNPYNGEVKPKTQTLYAEAFSGQYQKEYSYLERSIEKAATGEKRYQYADLLENKGVKTPATFSHAIIVDMFSNDILRTLTSMEGEQMRKEYEEARSKKFIPISEIPNEQLLSKMEGMLIVKHRQYWRKKGFIPKSKTIGTGATIVEWFKPLPNVH